MKGSKRILRGRGKSAVYELRVSTGKDAVTGKYAHTSLRSPGYGADDPEVTTADKALAKLVKELEGNRSGRTPGAGVTVDQVLTGWLKQITSEGRSPTTLREYRRLIDKRICPAHGSMPARKVTALELDEFYQGLTEGLAPASVRQVHAILRTGFRQGVKWRYLTSNPATDASPAKLASKPSAVPTVAEVQKMVVPLTPTIPKWLRSSPWRQSPPPAGVSCAGSDVAISTGRTSPSRSRGQLPRWGGASSSRRTRKPTPHAAWHSTPSGRQP